MRTTRPVAGGVSLVLLSTFLWLLFFQNMPDNCGVMACSRPPSTATVDRIIKLSMIAMCVYVMANRWSLTRLLAKTINPGVTAFMVLVPLSAVWSIDPDATLVRFITLAGIVLLCFAISLVGWDRQRLQRVAISPMMYVLIVSLVFGVLYPDKIIELGDDLSQKGAWHGITYNKNQFGMMASQVVIICFHRWLAREGRSYWSIAGTGVAFSCLLLSRSNTSLFATLVAVLFMVLVMRVPLIKRRYSTHVVVAIAVTLLLYELVIQDVIPGVNVLLGPVMSLTGKDTTFSSRTLIWNVIKEHIHAAPYLGTGYGAYWPAAPSPSSPSYIFLSLMYFYPTESHNGYLEILNDLGIAGMICLLVFLFYFVRQALQLMQFDRSQASLYLALLFQEMVMNMSESEWFSRTSTFAVLLLATTSLSRALIEHRRHAQSAGHTVR